MATAAALLAGGCSAGVEPQGSGGAQSLAATAQQSGATAAAAPTPTPEQTEAAAAGRSPWAGRAAPEFELPDDAGKPVRLADFRWRWVVLYFYSQGDTPGCTCQATEFTSLLQDFNGMNAAVVGVSPDSPASLEYFRHKYDLKITLLSDRDYAVARRYGAAHEYALPGGGPTVQVLRTTFLIDPAGRVPYHWPEVIPQGHAGRVRARLAALAGAGRPEGGGSPTARE